MIQGNPPDKVVRFTVWGEPKSKQRPRVTKRGTYTPKETMDAERRVRDIWRERNAEQFEHQVVVTIDFYNGNRRRRDLDNMAKLVLDALNGEAFADDVQVIELNVRKFYTDKHRARTEITMSEVIEFPLEGTL